MRSLYGFSICSELGQVRNGQEGRERGKERDGCTKWGKTLYEQIYNEIEATLI